MLPMVVLVVLIVVNLGLLYLLFRPDQALTAEPADQDRGEGALPAPRSSPTMMPSPSAPAEQTTSPSPSASKECDVVHPTNRASSCATAALRCIFQDCMAGDGWRLRYSRKGRAVDRRWR